MTISTVLILILGIACYFVLPFCIWCFKNDKVKTILTICFFALYLIVLFMGVFGQLEIGNKVVTINFDFSKEWCSKTIGFSFANIGKFDLVINIVMLIPVGMFIYFLSRKKKWWLKILILVGFGFLTGFFIETCQFILPIPRSVQLSDALLNMVSAFLGGMIAWFYTWFISKFIHKKQ